MIDLVMDNRSFFAPHSRDLMSVQDTVYTPIILSEDTKDSEGPQLIDPTYFSGVELGEDTFPTPRRVALPPRSVIRIRSPTMSIHHPSPISLDSTSSQPAGRCMRNTGLKCKSLIVKTELVEAKENKTKILAKSIDRIRITNMEMEERRAKS